MYMRHLKKLYADKGYVLFIGTGLCAATIIHYAEQAAGRTPFIRWTYNKQKNVIPVSVGSCSRGFEHFEHALNGFAKRTKVANSDWNCDRCNDAVGGGPVLDRNFWKLFCSE